MKTIILPIVLILPMLVTVPALASDKTDAMAPLHQLVDGFNKGDLKAAIAACADEASVIDDFPPHEWQGSGCRKWADAFDDISKKEGITDARIILGKPRRVDVTNDRAYVVVPVTLLTKHNGKPKKLPSMFTASLHKEAGGWRITGWAWADLQNLPILQRLGGWAITIRSSGPLRVGCGSLLGIAAAAAQLKRQPVNLKLGFFPQFKGADTVLVAGDPEGIAQLSSALGSFAVSSQDQLPIHSFAYISHTHPAELYASRSEQPSGSGFRWLCSPTALPTVQGKLAALINSGKGHQFFNLVASPVQLMVSVGEYSQSWWRTHGG